MIPWLNTHDGETALILGSGKSLKDVPRKLLEKYPTFGVNHIYLLPFQPTYFSCIDTFYLKNYAREMYNSAANAEIAFLSQYLLGAVGAGVRELYELDNVYLFSEETVRFPGEYCMAGESVSYVCLKIAFAMGFTTVLLTGHDRDERWEYFDKMYPAEHLEWRPKRNWRIKRNGMEYHLKLAGELYEEHDRRIVNLSLPSILDEYLERGEYKDFL